MKRTLLILAFVLLWSQSAFAAVAASDTKSNSTTGGSPLDLSTLTVSGSNTCLIALVNLGDATATVTATWDQGGSNQSMGSPYASQTFSSNMVVFKLIAPVAGNKTLRIAWSGGGGNPNGVVAAVNFTGADQSTCNNATDDVGFNYPAPLNPAIVTVTSSSDGATIGFITDYSTGINSVDAPQTSIFLQTTGGLEAAAGYRLGGSSNTHTFTLGGSDGTIQYGMHIIAASGGGSTPHNLTLLGVGN